MLLHIKKYYIIHLCLLFLKLLKTFSVSLNELSDKVKAISTKGLTKYLINKFSILNGAKYFSSGIFKN